MGEGVGIKGGGGGGRTATLVACTLHVALLVDYSVRHASLMQDRYNIIISQCREDKDWDLALVLISVMTTET